MLQLFILINCVFNCLEIYSYIHAKKYCLFQTTVRVQNANTCYDYMHFNIILREMFRVYNEQHYANHKLRKCTV